ncbi:hypothetical protein PsorP6_003588 [Peronosclerospora sorghi]|uniref:Uncharacterized protein n=1 Tax=Peronosclerospora sorghi TaxID=230839 RepID=A0ACC0VNH6_9STRA|nr:hypothetical protein PsorP6_003588 [Peronosclerospora sorghi]
MSPESATDTWSGILTQAVMKCGRESDRRLYMYGISSNRCPKCQVKLRNDKNTCISCQYTHETPRKCPRCSNKNDPVMWCADCDAYFCADCHKKPHVLMLGRTKPHHCFPIDGVSGKFFVEAAWSEAFTEMMQATYRLRLDENAGKVAPMISTRHQVLEFVEAEKSISTSMTTPNQPQRLSNSCAFAKPSSVEIGTCEVLSAPTSVSPLVAMDKSPPSCSRSSLEELSRKRQHLESDSTHGRPQKSICVSVSSQQAAASFSTQTRKTDGMILYDRVKEMHDKRVKAAQPNEPQAPSPKEMSDQFSSQREYLQQQQPCEVVQLEKLRLQQKQQQQQTERSKIVQKHQDIERFERLRAKYWQGEDRRQQEALQNQPKEQQTRALQKQQEVERWQAEQKRQDGHRQQEDQKHKEQRWQVIREKQCRQEEHKRKGEWMSQDEQRQQEEQRLQPEKRRQEVQRLVEKKQLEEQRVQEEHGRQEEQKLQVQRKEEEKPKQRLQHQLIEAHEQILKGDQARSFNHEGNGFVTQAQHALPQSGFASICPSSCCAPMPVATVGPTNMPASMSLSAQFTQLPSSVNVSPSTSRFDPSNPLLQNYLFQSIPGTSMANSFPSMESEKIYQGNAAVSVSRFENISHDQEGNCDLVVRDRNIQHQPQQLATILPDFMAPCRGQTGTGGFSPNKYGEDDELRAIWVGDYDKVNALVLQLDLEISKRAEEGHIFVHRSNNITIPEQLKQQINNLRAQRDAAIKKRFQSVVRVLIFSDSVRLFAQQNEHSNIWSDVPEVLKVSHNKCAKLAADIREFERQAQKFRERIDQAVSCGEPAQMQSVIQLGALIADLDRKIRTTNAERNKQFNFMFQFSESIRNLVRAEWALTGRGYHLQSNNKK